LYETLHLLTNKTGLEFKAVKKQILVRTARERTNYFLPSITTFNINIPSKINTPHYPANIPSDTLIQGKVTDEEGMPLPGVTVQVKKTTIGTITDASGDFSLNAPAYDTLVFSYIGYEKKKIAVTGGEELSVQLSLSASGLNEVVVVGYGTQKKMD